jgi:archaellum component FlaF (FlaF/FlaG flagellin family)
MHQKKLTMKEYLVGIVCILIIIVGIAITPYHANADMVNPRIVTSISVDLTKTTLQYQEGSTILPSDIYIKINGSLVSAQHNDVFIGSKQNAAVGSKTVTITYEGQTTTYQVTVVALPPAAVVLEKLAYDTVGAYSPAIPGISGVNFVATRQSTGQTIDMGDSATKNSDGTNYSDSVEFLEPGATYLFKVRSYVEVDGQRYYSGWSEEFSITLPQLTGVDKWRVEIKRQLIAHGVYSRDYEDIIINIIRHESKGNERAGEGRYYVGLLQFKETWSHSDSEAYFLEHGISNFQADNRLSGSWSVHEIVELIKHRGIRAVKQHWAGTWNI